MMTRPSNPKCTFYGIYPSFANIRVYKTPEMYAPVAKLNDRFVPVLRKITSAGWQPIPHAVSSHPDVWIERWGPERDGSIYWTVYNASLRTLSPTLTLDLKELAAHDDSLCLKDILNPGTWPVEVRRDKATTTLPVPAGQVRVLELARP